MSSDLEAQIAYFQKRLDELTGQSLKADAIISRATRELRQRRQAFALLSDLHRSVTTDMPATTIYDRLLLALHTSLKMDQALILLLQDGQLRPAARVGHVSGEEGYGVDVDGLDGPILATRNAPVTAFIEQVRQRLGLMFFLSVPIIVGDEAVGLLVCGRQREMKPFFPPLDEQDVHTLSALAGYLGSALSNARLYQNQRKMTESFRRFVPRQFLEILGRDSIVEVGLGEQAQRTMSILFSDIRSFTSISEKMTPKANFDFINRYLEFVAPAVLENGGFIDKYIGDAIMALFPGEADSAVRGAIGLHAGLDRFNLEWVLQGRARLEIGAGVHTGTLMLGTIGFHERMDTTVISDAVNLASRIEGLTKQYGAGLLISGDTRAALTDPQQFALRTVDRVMVKGKKEAIEIVEVLDAEPLATRAAKLDSKVAFEKSMELYAMGHFGRAARGFEAILRRNPGDGAARLLAQRCRRLQFEGRPPGWCGVVGMEK